MAFSDLFSVSFLVSLGITLLLTGLLGMFLVQKIQEQNHKMASMLGLVSTMAEELNFMRGRMQMMSYVPQNQQGGLNNQNQMESVNLIPVSDGDTSEDDSDTEDEDEEDDDDSSEDDSSENEDEEVQQFIELNPNAQSIKVINFSNSEDLENEEIEELQDVDVDDLNDLDDDDNDDSDENDDKEENDDNDNAITLHEVEPELENIDIGEQTKNLIKTIDIDVSTLEETTTIDYRKMSLNKLKSIAVNKGLITESDKVTKNALLKMLKAE